MEYVQPRVRIVVDNAESIELSAEGELETETRKYMENDVLTGF